MANAAVKRYRIAVVVLILIGAVGYVVAGIQRAGLRDRLLQAQRDAAEAKLRELEADGWLPPDKIPPPTVIEVPVESEPVLIARGRSEPEIVDRWHRPEVTVAHGVECREFDLGNGEYRLTCTVAAGFHHESAHPEPSDEPIVIDCPQWELLPEHLGVDCALKVIHPDGVELPTAKMHGTAIARTPFGDVNHARVFDSDEFNFWVSDNLAEAFETQIVPRRFGWWAQLDVGVDPVTVDQGFQVRPDDWRVSGGVSVRFGKRTHVGAGLHSDGGASFNVQRYGLRER